MTLFCGIMQYYYKSTHSHRPCFYETPRELTVNEDSGNPPDESLWFLKIVNTRDVIGSLHLFDNAEAKMIFET